MALPFPLTEAQFFDKLRVATVTLSAPEPLQVDRTASGAVLPASIGDPLWQGEIRLADNIFASDVFEIEALIGLLNRAGSSFLMYDPRKKYPTSDPDGSIILGSSPTIGSIASNKRDITLAGMPSGYTITAGDLLSFTYGTSPVRYALHRAVTGATVEAGQSVTGTFEVTPMLPDGAAIADPVTLSKPPLKAVLQPNPTYGAGRPAVVPGAVFGFSQTLR